MTTTTTPTVYLARVETRSWDLEATGATAVEARACLRAGFEDLMTRNGGTLRWSEISDDVYVRALAAAPTFYVNGEPAGSPL